MPKTSLIVLIYCCQELLRFQLATSYTWTEGHGQKWRNDFFGMREITGQASEPSVRIESDTLTSLAQRVIGFINRSFLVSLLTRNLTKLF
jgi:hypothetical protein